MTAVRNLAPVVDLHDGFVEGDAPPLVPDGEYQAVYIGHDVVELAQFHRAAKVFVRVRLHDAGAHTGTVLFRAYRVRRRIDSRRFVAGRRSEIVKMVARVLGQTGRPDRISLRDLKRHLLRVLVRTVTTDAKQRALPPSLHYSVIDTIVGTAE